MSQNEVVLETPQLDANYPVATQPAQEPSDPQATNAEGPRVLLVEDEDEQALLVEKMLSDGAQKARLVRVSRVDAAIRALTDEAFTVILADLTLPDGIGLDVVARLVEAAPHSALVVLTELADREMAMTAVQSGAQDYLVKGSFSADALNRCIHVAQERKRAEGQLRWQAHFDQLTGLPNRLLFRQSLTQALARARRLGTPLWVVLIDVDSLKDINDVYGYRAGDAWLVEAARRLQLELREYDVVARLGGDEFGVVVDMLDSPEQAVGVAHRLVAALEQPVTLADSVVSVSACAGVALFPQSGEEVDHLLRAGQEALYQAKQVGNGHVHLQAGPASSDTLPELRLWADLREALTADQFRLHYQPIVDMQSGKVIAAEALVRWERPGSGLVPPAVFLPMLERSRGILEVGRWVLDTACAQLRQWKDEGKDIQSITVNLSNRQFEGSDLVDQVQDALITNQLPASALQLEVTESALLRDPAQAGAVIERLRAIGVRVALDDFGTGYSSLAYLHRFPVDVLKIDRSFVADLGFESDSLVKAIIQLGHTLDMKVVAEGVETREQAEWLADAGCHQAQGWLYARPRDAGSDPTTLG